MEAVVALSDEEEEQVEGGGGRGGGGGGGRGMNTNMHGGSGSGRNIPIRKSKKGIDPPEVDLPLNIPAEKLARTASNTVAGASVCVAWAPASAGPERLV